MEVNPEPPPAVKRPAKSKKVMSVQDQIRRDETLLADIWTSPVFIALMVLAVIGLAVALYEFRP